MRGDPAKHEQGYSEPEATLMLQLQIQDPPGMEPTQPIIPAAMSPVACRMIKNFLTKTNQYFNTDYAVFLHTSHNTPDRMFFTIASDERLSEQQLEMVRGIFQIQFICACEDDLSNLDVDTIEYYRVERNALSADPETAPGDYRHELLINRGKIRGMIGAGYFRHFASYHDNNKWNEHGQFLTSTGMALLLRL